MSKAKTIADAVAKAINDAELSMELTQAAVVSFAPDFDLPDLKELTIVVGPLQSSSAARITDQPIGVFIQQKVAVESGETEDEKVAELLTFCDGIETLFEKFTLQEINAFCVKINRDPLFDFDRLREDGLFAAGLELEFKVIT
jgi:predicted Abi (CAAX) family protease